jgi:hypothetical protein
MPLSPSFIVYMMSIKNFCCWKSLAGRCQYPGEFKEICKNRPNNVKVGFCSNMHPEAKESSFKCERKINKSINNIVRKSSTHM